MPKTSRLWYRCCVLFVQKNRQIKSLKFGVTQKYNFVTVATLGQFVEITCVDTTAYVTSIVKYEIVTVKIDVLMHLMFVVPAVYR